MRYEDLTGRRFGRLVVLKRTNDHVKKNGNKQTVFSVDVIVEMYVRYSPTI